MKFFEFSKYLFKRWEDNKMNISDKTFKTLEEDLLKATAKLLNKRSRYFYKNEIKIPKKSLVMMCGTPGAGKTTIARKICSQLKDSIHVDIDYLFDCATKTLYPNAQSLSVEDIDLIAKEAYDKAYRNAEEILANGNTVIWDNLGIFPTERAEVLNGLRTKYDYAILIVVNCDKLQAILRSIRRGDSQNRTYLILNTHTYLQLQLQNPTKYFIGFDEVYIIDGTQEVTVKEP
uniref:AAA family ATPase n=1 Tax=Candidatus Merdicola sp. TaxID=3085652 RepID=UPI003FED9386